MGTTPARAGFSVEQVETALERMRSGARKAHADTLTLTGPPAVQAAARMALFAEAAADLAGTSVDAESARAAGVPAEPAWSLR